PVGAVHLGVVEPVLHDPPALVEDLGAEGLVIDFDLGGIAHLPRGLRRGREIGRFRRAAAAAAATTATAAAGRRGLTAGIAARVLVRQRRGKQPLAGAEVE